MQQKSPLAHKVERAVEGVLSHEGYELILVEFLPQSRLLRLYIDFCDVANPPAQEVLQQQPSQEHDRTITLEDCTKVSHLVSDVLDGEGIMDEGQGEEMGRGYRLEISSPGLDRPLVKPTHFQKFSGQSVRLSTRGRLEGLSKRRFEARLVGADDEGIDIEFEEAPHRIAYRDLDRAQLVPTF